MEFKRRVSVGEIDLVLIIDGELVIVDMVGLYEMINLGIERWMKIKNVKLILVNKNI